MKIIIINNMGSNLIYSNTLKKFQNINHGFGMKDYSIPYFKLNQTHSNYVQLLTNDEQFCNADGIITQLPNIRIGVHTADCIPLLLYEKTQNIIGAIHCGWRGLFNNIVQNALNIISFLKGDLNDTIAIIGPSIKYKSYEVSKDFYDTFNNPKYFKFKSTNKYYFNLSQYCKDQLTGVQVIKEIKLNTYLDNRFWSYRYAAKHGNLLKERQISWIMIKDV